MKHLFFVHSCINYVASLSVIKQFNVNKQECIILSRRRLKVDYQVNVKFRYIPDVFEDDRFETYGLADKQLSFIARKRLVHEMDKVIDSFVQGGEFTAYVPYTQTDVIQLIITHRCCKAIAILEEGMLSYSSGAERYLVHLTSANHNSLWRTIKRWFRYPIHLNRLLVHRSYQAIAPIPVLTFNPEFVQPHPSIDIQKIYKIYAPNTSYNEKWDNTSFFFFSPEVEDNLTDWDSYRQALQVFLQYYSKINTSALWVKFHPRQKLMAEILAVLNASKVRYNIFPSDKCVEFVLYSSSNIISYGFISSLLLYTSFSGNTGYSLIKMLRQFDKEAFPDLPRIFYEYIKLL